MIANGEIWTPDDAARCRRVSGCASLMLGRGMVADPGLAHAVRAARAPEAGDAPLGVPWDELLPHLATFWRLVGARVQARHRAGRLKQWLNLLRRRYPQAQRAYDAIRPIDDPAVVARMMFADPPGR